jgi:hypothetical protein
VQALSASWEQAQHELDAAHVQHTSHAHAQSARARNKT